MQNSKAKIHTFSTPDDTMEMLNAVADYHRMSKSATIGALVKKEFWRIFPEGTTAIKPLQGARVQRGQKSRKKGYQ
jgi:hypothetical protein